jgi:hypothetical protein
MASPRVHRLTIIAQDPDVRRDDGRILTAEASVPMDRLEPGPRGHRFHVVDYDATERTLVEPVADLCDPDVEGAEHRWTCLDRFSPPSDTADENRRFPNGYNDALLTDPAFRAQNVYAIAARTLAAFEFALGRRIDWKTGSHQLYIVPRAFAEANAHYAREDRGVFFGYLPRPGEPTVYTCLSHDIVCHETTHAVLDGLRPRFLEPALPDQAAFHEALADIVAIFSVFSLPEALEHELGRPRRGGRIPMSRFRDEAIAKSVLFGVAEEVGKAITGVRGSALRRSREIAPGDWWRSDARFEEPHRRGEVLVAAVIDAMATIWIGRVKEIAHHGTVNRARAAEEGAKAANHVMTMVIRSLDYSPAVELEFEDVLDAILVADEVVAPDDKHDYRGTVERSFARYDIHRAQGGIVDVAAAGTPFRYDQINAAALRTSKQEAFRFIWQNLDALGLKPSWYLEVESLRPAVRLGPDGLLVQEVICDYSQVLELTAGQARRDARRYPGLVLPDESALPDAVPLQLWGGGTLIFDQFGRAKFHQHKDLDDWERQTRRLEYLLRKGLFDTYGRLGFSTGAAAGMGFADMHAPDDRAGEAW